MSPRQEQGRGVLFFTTDEAFVRLTGTVSQISHSSLEGVCRVPGTPFYGCHEGGNEKWGGFQNWLRSSSSFSPCSLLSYLHFSILPQHLLVQRPVLFSRVEKGAVLCVIYVLRREGWRCAPPRPGRSAKTRVDYEKSPRKKRKNGNFGLIIGRQKQDETPAHGHGTMRRCCSCCAESCTHEIS